jgi:hypothetical protein
VLKVEIVARGSARSNLDSVEYNRPLSCRFKPSSPDNPGVRQRLERGAFSPDTIFKVQ